MASLGNVVWVRMASTRLAVVLSLLVALVATIGTIIQPSAQHFKEYGALFHWWFVELGFAGLNHSWLFLGFLALLGINCCAWLILQFPVMWESVRQNTSHLTLPGFLGRRHLQRLKLTGEEDAVASKVSDMLMEKGYGVRLTQGNTGAAGFAAIGMLGCIGNSLLRFSVLVIFMGGLLGVTLGFREFGSGLEGEIFYIPQGDFHLRVDRFLADQGDDGPDQFSNTTLTVIDQGQEILTETIRTDNPLVYKNIRIYLFNFGEAWDRIEKVGIRISDRATRKALKDVVLHREEVTVVKDLDLQMAVMAFVADFGFDPHKNTVFSKSEEHRNPAVRVMIRESQQKQATPWLLFALPGLIQMDQSKYWYEVLGYIPRKYAQLRIVKDSGMGFVWYGSAILVIGMTLSLFVYHREERIGKVFGN